MKFIKMITPFLMLFALSALSKAEEQEPIQLKRISSHFDNGEVDENTCPINWTLAELNNFYKKLDKKSKAINLDPENGANGYGSYDKVVLNRSQNFFTRNITYKIIFTRTDEYPDGLKSLFIYWDCSYSVVK